MRGFGILSAMKISTKVPMTSVRFDDETTSMWTGLSFNGKTRQFKGGRTKHVKL